MKLGFYELASRADLIDRFWFLYREMYNSEDVVQWMLGELSDSKLEKIVRRME